jgi:hypothetical protein
VAAYAGSEGSCDDGEVAEGIEDWELSHGVDKDYAGMRGGGDGTPSGVGYLFGLEEGCYFVVPLGVAWCDIEGAVDGLEGSEELLFFWGVGTAEEDVEPLEEVGVTLFIDGERCSVEFEVAADDGFTEGFESRVVFLILDKDVIKLGKEVTSKGF